MHDFKSLNKNGGTITTSQPKGEQEDEVNQTGSQEVIMQADHTDQPVAECACEPFVKPLADGFSSPWGLHGDDGAS